METVFKFDVFLSHSSKDKAVVRPLAERLRKDGVKVWFDEWEIKPDDIRLLHRYSQGLTNDRLQLCYDPFAEIRIPMPTDLAEQRRIEQSETLIAGLRQTKAAICQHLFT